jgi:hypothetical protein
MPNINFYKIVSAAGSRIDSGGKWLPDSYDLTTIYKISFTYCSAGA